MYRIYILVILKSFGDFDELLSVICIKSFFKKNKTYKKTSSGVVHNSLARIAKEITVLLVLLASDKSLHTSCDLQIILKFVCEKPN